MTAFTLGRVPQILFGAGRVMELARHLPRDGAVLIVADPAMAKLGLMARVTDELARTGITAATYDGFSGEPRAADVNAATALARGVTAVIGLGGGSALDTAKLVACCAMSGRPAEDYALCQTPLPANRLRLIAIPTTAGTGSEVTRAAVFASATGEKTWAWGEALKPDLAILDPELTLDVPPQVTAATGLDALVHAIEAASNRQSNAGSDLYCLKAIGLIAANLERAVKYPADLQARCAMLLASCYAGIGIDNCGTALAHNISHAIAALAPIAHGRATGLAMLATLDWVLETNRQPFAGVAAALGTPDPVKGYERLLRATGIKTDLAGEGFDLGNPALLAAQMAHPANAPMRKSTRRYPGDADLLLLARMMLEVR